MGNCCCGFERQSALDAYGLLPEKPVCLLTQSKEPHILVPISESLGNKHPFGQNLPSLIVTVKILSYVGRKDAVL